MANGIFTGIIQTPEQIETARKQRMFEEAKAIGSLTPQQQALMIARQSGQNIGSLVGQLFGVEDPELKKARDLQAAAMSIKESLPAEDQLNPGAVYSAMSKAALNLGYTNEAMQFATEAGKFNIQERKMRLDEAKVAADIAREARQGRLTEAQIKQIDAQIANLGSAYEYQVIKGPAGETVSILAINKKNPSDVRTINTTPDAASMPSAPVSAGEWNYVPGQGLVKGK